MGMLNVISESIGLSGVSLSKWDHRSASSAQVSAGEGRGLIVATRLPSRTITAVSPRCSTQSSTRRKSFAASVIRIPWKFFSASYRKLPQVTSESVRLDSSALALAVKPGADTCPTTFLPARGRRGERIFISLNLIEFQRWAHNCCMDVRLTRIDGNSIYFLQKQSNVYL